MKKKLIHAHIEEKQYKWLQKEAKKRDRSMAYIIREILEKQVSNPRICPKCGNQIIGYPALSREDNKTEICSNCGTKEALQEFTFHTKKKGEK